ncbi:S1 RNA-binding domain-containing protein [Clostridium neuense]|uniref:S1 RNA-binding domain-containing protein n=1 Tax=Clostridium neuense TaxID=1728934 RepID=A0ABW8TG82_9CLOT
MAYRILDKTLYEITASKQSKKILTGVLAAVESFKVDNSELMDCGVIFFNEFKIFIPIKDMNITRQDKKVIRSMLGAEVDYLIKEIDEINKVATASRSEAMELRKSIELKKHDIGDKVLVRITSVGRKNCIVDCYGIECSVPISEIDYGYIDDINKHVKVGDKVPGVIKKIDIQNNIISVSLKEAKDDPYDNLINSIKKGGEYVAKVTGIQPYGIFLTIREGMNCLCPFPNWSNFSPSIGERFVVKIKSIKSEDRKINANLMRQIS